MIQNIPFSEPAVTGYAPGLYHTKYENVTNEGSEITRLSLHRAHLTSVDAFKLLALRARFRSRRRERGKASLTGTAKAIARLGTTGRPSTTLTTTKATEATARLRTTRWENTTLTTAKATETAKGTGPSGLSARMTRQAAAVSMVMTAPPTGCKRRLSASEGTGRLNIDRRLISWAATLSVPKLERSR